jgi:hypothetical protein
MQRVCTDTVQVCTDTVKIFYVLVIQFFTLSPMMSTDTETCSSLLYYLKDQQDATLAVCLLVTARLLYMFRTLSASIIRSTKNCISSHWCVSWVGMILVLYII